MKDEELEYYVVGPLLIQTKDKANVGGKTHDIDYTKNLEL